MPEINKGNATMDIKKSIKLAMAHRDISQLKLAELAGVGVVTISNIVTGKSNPTTEIVNKLAEATGYSMSEFIALGE